MFAYGKISICYLQLSDFNKSGVQVHLALVYFYKMRQDHLTHKGHLHMRSLSWGFLESIIKILKTITQLNKIIKKNIKNMQYCNLLKCTAFSIQYNITYIFNELHDCQVYSMLLITQGVQKKRAR